MILGSQLRKYDMFSVSLREGGGSVGSMAGTALLELIGRYGGLLKGTRDCRVDAV